MLCWVLTMMALPALDGEYIAPAPQTQGMRSYWALAQCFVLAWHSLDWRSHGARQRIGKTSDLSVEKRSRKQMTKARRRLAAMRVQSAWTSAKAVPTLKNSLPFLEGAKQSIEPSCLVQPGSALQGT